MQAVIYIFQCPKGRVYAGRRTVSPEALRCWPNRGTGPLPDGYKGSGKAWQRVARKHGDALVWRIVARVDGGRAQVDAAERRAIHLARLTFGRRCVNVLEGGQGFTSQDAKAVADRNAADPEWTARNRAHLEKLNSDPAQVERRAAQIRQLRLDLLGQAKRTAAAAEASRRPEVAAKKSASMRSSPVARAHLEVLHTDPAIRAKWLEVMADPVLVERRAAQLAKANADPVTIARRAEANADPEKVARGQATRLRNWVRKVNAKNRARRMAEQSTC